MSLVIAVFAVIIVATLITRYYPHPKPKNTLAEGEILVCEVEEQIQESARAVVPEEPKAPKPKKTRAPKMDAKPKKTKKQNNG